MVCDCVGSMGGRFDDVKGGVSLNLWKGIGGGGERGWAGKGAQREEQLREEQLREEQLREEQLLEQFSTLSSGRLIRFASGLVNGGALNSISGERNVVKCLLYMLTSRVREISSPRHPELTGSQISQAVELADRVRIHCLRVLGASAGSALLSGTTGSGVLNDADINVANALKGITITPKKDDKVISDVIKKSQKNDSNSNKDGNDGSSAGGKGDSISDSSPPLVDSASVDGIPSDSKRNKDAATDDASDLVLLTASTDLLSSLGDLIFGGSSGEGAGKDATSKSASTEAATPLITGRAWDIGSGDLRKVMESIVGIVAGVGRRPATNANAGGQEGNNELGGWRHDTAVSRIKEVIGMRIKGLGENDGDEEDDGKEILEKARIAVEAADEAVIMAEKCRAILREISKDDEGGRDGGEGGRGDDGISTAESGVEVGDNSRREDGGEAEISGGKNTSMKSFAGRFFFSRSKDKDQLAEAEGESVSPDSTLSHPLLPSLDSCLRSASRAVSHSKAVYSRLSFGGRFTSPQILPNHHHDTIAEGMLKKREMEISLELGRCLQLVQIYEGAMIEDDKGDSGKDGKGKEQRQSEILSRGRTKGREILERMLMPE